MEEAWVGFAFVLLFVSMVPATGVGDGGCDVRVDIRRMLSVCRHQMSGVHLSPLLVRWGCAGATRHPNPPQPTPSHHIPYHADEDKYTYAFCPLSTTKTDAQRQTRWMDGCGVASCRTRGCLDRGIGGVE